MAMDTASVASIPVTISPLPAPRSVYLQRLERLQRLRLQHEGELNQRGRRLLDHAVFAAYCMCRDIGAEREALEILRSIASNEATPPPPSEIFS